MVTVRQRTDRILTNLETSPSADFGLSRWRDLSSSAHAVSRPDVDLVSLLTKMGVTAIFLRIYLASSDQKNELGGP